MPTLRIRNVPEHLVESLQRRAQRNGRTLEGELMALIREAVALPLMPEPSSGRRTGGTVRIEQIAREHRRRRPNPIDRAPRAVDIIRRDRDTR